AHPQDQTGAMTQTRVLFALLLVSVLGSSASAGGTHQFRVTSHRDFDEGEAQGVILSALGEATAGYETTKTAIAEAGIFSMALGGDGTVYLGTGDSGAIYSVTKGTAKKIGKLESPVVSALAEADGALYAGGVGDGRVFSMDRDGKVA